jgi:hypothetical protein
VDYPSAIEDNLSFSRKYKCQSAFGIANVQWLKIHIQDEYRLL